MKAEARRMHRGGAGIGGSMVYNFSERKDLNEKVEKKLLLMKEEYQRQEMSASQREKLLKTMEGATKMNRTEANKKRMARAAVIAAVIAGVFVLLPNTSASVAHAMEQLPVIGGLVEAVTFRNYSYETDQNMADIDVPGIQVAGRTENHEVQENLKRTAEEINAEIEKISEGLIAEFEAGLKEEKGYNDVVVTSEALATAQDYFTLKLICFQASGSGYEWNYYYTIDLNTGERLKLRDLFREGADYITAISENIKKQMREQMDADDEVMYWLDEETDEWNFKAITDETSFYLNEKGNVVIGFNEGDVAPMYMGTVEFEIPAEVLADIRK